ncbi:MAG: hypothetical protein JSW27_08860 [Phycisphaerales bacterium]|nr:MAG: hypothetical protein JSW27_08860 [Phycisphaerales bacterium]
MVAQTQPLSNPRSKDVATVIGVLLVVLILSAALLANSMTKLVSRDEHMYCTAGALLARGQAIYRDFAYPSQLPYHPLLLAILYRVFHTSHYLLVGRLVSVVCEILVLVSIVGIYRAVFGSRREGLILGAAAAVLYVFNPLVEYAGGYAWNHSVVVLCVTLSLWLLITTDFQKTTRYGRPALIGALLTFATCMRITTALVQAVFLAAICITARGSVRNRVYAGLAFSLASLALALWPVWIVIRAGEAFWLNLLRIPALYGRWLHEIGIVHDKTALTIAALLTPGYLALLALAAWLVWVLLRRWRTLEVPTKTMAATAGILPLVLLLIAYIPPTMWRQYLAIPVPFILIALAYPLAAWHSAPEKAASRRSFRFGWAGIGICVAVTILANPAVLSRSLAVLVPEYWVPSALHRVSANIARQTGRPKRVLTLGPLYALEGGCHIYPELACGAIVYRVADAMSAQERAATRTVGLQTLGPLLEERPPTAVILGVEPRPFAFLEEPLHRAVGPDWHRNTYEYGLLVYTRP